MDVKSVDTRRLAMGTACLIAAILSIPVPAAAQRQVFFQGVAELAEAADGIYGDEGAAIGRALDTMSRALDAWDREIATAAGERKPSAQVLRRLIVEANGGLPLLPLAVYRQGFDQLAIGELRSAIDEFRRAASADPLVTGTPAQSGTVRRALVALRQGRLADARTQLEQPGTLDDSSEAHRVLGLVYWAESEFDKSIGQLEAAIRTNPRDERSRLALSRVLSSAGRDADAQRALQDTLRVIPESGRAHWWLATSYERTNRFADARHEFELAASKAVAGRSHLLATVGRLASGAADGAGAVDALTRAVADDPANPAWHKLLAGALLLEDRPDDALAEFAAALRIDPRDGDAHLGVGQIRLNAGRNAEALDPLRRATELRPDSIDAAYALATVLTRLGNSHEAAPYFERVEQLQRQRQAERRRTLSLDTLREEADLRSREGRYDRAAPLWRQLADLYAEAGRAQDAAHARAMYEAAKRGGARSR